MSDRCDAPVVLVANNPYGHHLLTAQLLNLYEELALDTEVMLLCNGVVDGADADTPPWLSLVPSGTSWPGVAGHLSRVFKLVGIRRRYPHAVYHLRGFLAGALFFVSRLGLLRSARYIYDPRGSFYVEWSEAGRTRVVGRLIRAVERQLVRHSSTTIVTSDRFAELYRQIFGPRPRYVTIYNATSFPYTEPASTAPSTGRVRFVYLGTFNYWHDMDELARVMACASAQIGSERVEISIYTLPRFHDAVRERFADIECAGLTVDYVRYSDVPSVLADKHVGVSVVRPTESSCIASPIKVADYIALGLVPLINAGIGDFDEHFVTQDSGILYEFGGPVDLSYLESVSCKSNKVIYDLVTHLEACRRLAPVVERLRHG